VSAIPILAAAGAWPKPPQNDCASQEGATPKPGAVRGPCGASSERLRSRWDGEFESPLLQQPVCLSGEPRGCKRKAPHFGGGLRMAGDVRRDVEPANRDSFALSLWRTLMQSHLWKALTVLQ
jgi:hypothetical protein